MSKNNYISKKEFNKNINSLQTEIAQLKRENDNNNKNIITLAKIFKKQITKRNQNRYNNKIT